MDKIIVKLTDEDIGLPKKELSNPIIRYGARGIVINYDGKIAIFNKIKKNEYKLPGGGLIGDETPREAFVREILEETGCNISKIEELGLAVEEKGQTNFRQVSHVFQANVANDTQELHLTDKELDEGGRVIWLPLKDAYERVLNSFDSANGSKYDDRYRTLFMIKRDALILKYFIDHQSNDADLSGKGMQYYQKK